MLPDTYTIPCCPECGRDSSTVYRENMAGDIVGCPECLELRFREDTAMQPVKCPNCGGDIGGEQFLTTLAGVVVTCNICCAKTTNKGEP